MKRLGKKGIGLLYLTVLAVMIALGALIYLILRKGAYISEIGTTQMKLLNSFELAEKTSFYIDASASIASRMAAEKVAESGGYAPEPVAQAKCGRVIHPLLNSPAGEECKPDTVPEFKSAFTQTFYTLLSQYEAYDLSNVEYSITVSESSGDYHVKVAANTPIMFPVYSTLSSYYNKGRAVSTGTQSSEEIQGLAKIENIPNVICDEKDTRFGKICQANKELVERLKQISAEELVRNDKKMIITQAYRTWEIQKALYDCFMKGDRSCAHACNPGAQGTAPRCPHMLAGAIDVTLIGPGGENINKLRPAELEALMCKYGFVRWKGEDWHFEYGTYRWEQALSLRANGLEACTYG